MADLGGAGRRAHPVRRSGSRPSRSKFGGYLRGLVGYRKMHGVRDALRSVKPPSGFNPGWIARGGGKVDAVYGIAPGRTRCSD